MENEELLKNQSSVIGGDNFLSKLFWVFDFLRMSFVIIVLVQTFFYRTMQVEGESMQDTFQSGEQVASVGFLNNPKLGDVVIINTYDLLERTIIKRFIASEGQTVNIDNDGEVYVDGKKLDEPYIKNGWKTNKRQKFKYPVTIPRGCFFAMGDNRLASDDSRYYGFFRLDKIVGKVCARIYPFNRIKFF